MEKTITQKGALIISLDFELLWGIFDKVDPGQKEEYFRNTRKIIPQILQLFETYDVSCTWAIVGMLFNKNWQDWNNNKPGGLPHYENKKLSPYEFGDRIRKTGSETLCFATDLIRLIKKTKGQEIGTHTYSHFYCREEGQTIEDFTQDLRKVVEMANLFEVDIKSLVFPRNQFNEDYLEVCQAYGIKNVRSNPDAWYWKNPDDSLLTKIFRTGDAYLGPRNKSYSATALRKEANKPLQQKASRLLRPYSSNPLINFIKLRRIRSEMTYAAKNNQIYHLWWHPHNFGDNPQENIVDLVSLLKHYKKLNSRYEFQSKNMQELNELMN